MKSINIEHNMDDVELEEALEKALNGVRSVREMPKNLPHVLADQLRDEGDKLFEHVLANMVSEIEEVVNGKKR